ncbi:unnamed protein product [Closterium sp. Naga37s-1]|nr:unnamed protein product [Closterium sp. Naga37s-1]
MRAVLGTEPSETSLVRALYLARGDVAKAINYHLDLVHVERFTLEQLASSRHPLPLASPPAKARGDLLALPPPHPPPASATSPPASPRPPYVAAASVAENTVGENNAPEDAGAEIGKAAMPESGTERTAVDPAECLGDSAPFEVEATRRTGALTGGDCAPHSPCEAPSSPNADASPPAALSLSPDSIREPARSEGENHFAQGNGEIGAASSVGAPCDAVSPVIAPTDGAVPPTSIISPDSIVEPVCLGADRGSERDGEISGECALRSPCAAVSPPPADSAAPDSMDAPDSVPPLEPYDPVEFHFPKIEARGNGEGGGRVGGKEGGKESGRGRGRPPKWASKGKWSKTSAGSSIVRFGTTRGGEVCHSPFHFFVGFLHSLLLSFSPSHRLSVSPSLPLPLTASPSLPRSLSLPLALSLSPSHRLSPPLPPIPPLLSPHLPHPLLFSHAARVYVQQCCFQKLTRVKERVADALYVSTAAHITMLLRFLNLRPTRPADFTPADFNRHTENLGFGSGCTDRAASKRVRATVAGGESSEEGEGEAKSMTDEEVNRYVGVTTNNQALPVSWVGTPFTSLPGNGASPGCDLAAAVLPEAGAALDALHGNHGADLPPFHLSPSQPLPSSIPPPSSYFDSLPTRLSRFFDSASWTISVVARHSTTTFSQGKLPWSFQAQWREAEEGRSAECEAHTAPGVLSVMVYYGSQRQDEARLLAQHDVVITTYGTLQAEYKRFNQLQHTAEGSVATQASAAGAARAAGAVRQGPLHSVQWCRAVLDEAHCIKNRASGAAAATFALQADSRWCLTGTPIQNQLEDVYSLLRFLRVQPWDNWGWWQRLVQQPYERGDMRSFKLLQGLLKPLMLRRTKDSKDRYIETP